MSISLASRSEILWPQSANSPRKRKKFSPKAAGHFLIEHGVKAAFITLGKNGAYVFNREGCAYEPPVPGKRIDTNGAGDCFCGSVLFRIRNKNEPVENISLAELSEFAHFANAAASLCIEQRGAIPSMPTPEAVNERLQAAQCEG